MKPLWGCHEFIILLIIVQSVYICGFNHLLKEFESLWWASVASCNSREAVPVSPAPCISHHFLEQKEIAKEFI